MRPPGFARFAALAALLALATLVPREGRAQTASDTEAYRPTIFIQGPKEQRDLIRAQLDSLAKLPTGERLLAAIEAATKDGKTLTIEYHLGDARGGSYDAVNSQARRWSIDEQGVLTILEPGAGASAAVLYDPSFLETRKDLPVEGGLSCLKPEVILGHELAHALHALQGRMLKKVPWTEPNGNETNYEERVTTGLGGIADPDGFTENALRRDLAVADRETYARFCEAPAKSTGVKSVGMLEKLARAAAAAAGPSATPRRSGGPPPAREPRPAAGAAAAGWKEHPGLCGGPATASEPGQSAVEPKVSNGKATRAERLRDTAKLVNGPLGE